MPRLTQGSDADLSSSQLFQLRSSGTEAVAHQSHTSNPTVALRQEQRRIAAKKNRSIEVVGCTGRCGSTSLAAQVVSAGGKFFTHERANPDAADHRLGPDLKDHFNLFDGGNAAPDPDKVDKWAKALLEAIDKHVNLSDPFAGDISHTNNGMLEQLLEMDDRVHVTVLHRKDHMAFARSVVTYHPKSQPWEMHTLSPIRAKHPNINRLQAWAKWSAQVAKLGQRLKKDIVKL